MLGVKNAKSKYPLCRHPIAFASLSLTLHGLEPPCGAGFDFDRNHVRPLRQQVVHLCDGIRLVAHPAVQRRFLVKGPAQQQVLANQLLTDSSGVDQNRISGFLDIQHANPTRAGKQSDIEKQWLEQALKDAVGAGAEVSVSEMSTPHTNAVRKRAAGMTRMPVALSAKSSVPVGLIR